MAGYTLLRLPWEVKDLFKDWLERNYPLKAKHVMARIRDMRGGRENDPQFGSRMKGEGSTPNCCASVSRLPASGWAERGWTQASGLHEIPPPGSSAGEIVLIYN